MFKYQAYCGIADFVEHISLINEYTLVSSQFTYSKKIKMNCLPLLFCEIYM